MSRFNFNVFASMSRRRPESPSLIVVGLGNPEPQYESSPHNVGFWCIGHLADRHGLTLNRAHRTTRLADGEIEGSLVALARPRTYVNRTGDAVRYLLDRYRVACERLLIVCDDIALPPGKIRLRPRGSAGGHNGIKSIIAALGVESFARLRIGVGQPPPGTDQIGYLLNEMAPDRHRQVEEAVERATDAVACLLTEGITEAMNRFN
ncbi:aminoacyl-tRNA hydrolase [Dehalococcoidia bacterium]|nr:aminoacyl-tRNA hydrolase [Dehalococcoidia bacterium]